MELTGKIACTFGGENFFFDTELCLAEACFVCNDGVWEFAGIAGV